jgi:hypothetical protein
MSLRALQPKLCRKADEIAPRTCREPVIDMNQGSAKLQS